MSSSSKQKTGGNTEPMTFVRRFGDEEEYGGGGGGHGGVKAEPLDDSFDSSADRHGHHSSGKKSKSKHRSRSRERSVERSSKRKKKRSRSRSNERDERREKKERKHRERSRDRSPSPRERGDRHHREMDRGSFGGGGDDQYYQQQQQQYYQPENGSGGGGGVSGVPPPLDPMAAAVAAAQMAAQRIREKIGGAGGGGAATAVKTEVKTEAGAGGGDDWLPGETAEQRRERRRKSRWSTNKSFIPGMPTILPSNLDETQRQIYLLTMEIEDCTRRIRTADYIPPPDAERSPSPEPIYDANGKRLNTREVRKKQELEQRRHEKIQALLKLNPDYKPPGDYRPPNFRYNDKVWIPQDENPSINFVGLLIGPRGNTLKALEAETGAKIIIRGKGSVKEGKLSMRQGPLPGADEPLHAYVTSTDREAVKRGCDKVREIINAALMIPDGQNELRKLQLRELAILNGTLRPEDFLLGGTRCTNCGSDQHKTWECMEAPNITAQIMCAACGGYGHLTTDCKNPRPGFQFDGAAIDSEYTALMAELGEKPPPGMFPPTAVGFTGQPRFPVGFPQQTPRFVMPSGAPIVRVNLAEQVKTQPKQGTPTSVFAPSFYPTPTDPSGYAAAAAAWAAYMSAQGYPNPVPPPPDGAGESGGGGDAAGGGAAGPSGAGLAGLAYAPPPPPPPPPVPAPKTEWD